MPTAWLRWWIACLLAIGVCSCQPLAEQVGKNHALLSIQASNGHRDIVLAGAGNEWVDFVVSVNGAPDSCQLRLIGLDRLGPDAHWYRMDASEDALTPIRSDSGQAAVSGLKGSQRIWIDLHIPASTPAGNYRGSCQLVWNSRVLAQIPIAAQVYPFSLPDAPALTIAGEATSAGLRRLYGGILPPTVEPLIEQCQQNRVQLWFSELQPASHWPAKTELQENSLTSAAARACAWRAELDNSTVLLCQGALCATRGAGDWFYAGDRFGVSGPVQTVMLKRLRDSEEQYEYLSLAKRLSKSRVRELAGLLVRPMRGNVDPIDRLLGGPMDEAAFDQGKEFLARMIIAPQLSSHEQEQWRLQMIRWIAEHSRPRMLVRSSDWSWDLINPGQIDLKISVDIYNPSDIQPTRSRLKWLALPVGWRGGTDATVPVLRPYRITHATLGASCDATLLHITSSSPTQLGLVSGYDGSTSALSLRLPVASCDRRSASPAIDGSLRDWSMDDAMFVGTLGRLPATILSSFSATHLFLAFRLQATGGRNCRVSIQPMFSDNSSGKRFVLTCMSDGTMQSTAKNAIQYAATVAGGIWRGEVAIPWRILVGSGRALPTALRFNFTRRGAAGGGGSWAGIPDGNISPPGISGILILRDAPGELVQNAAN